MARKKNAAAVALGSRSGINLTKEQRKARARKAVNTRWHKTKQPTEEPKGPWYGLVVISQKPGGWQGLHQFSQKNAEKAAELLDDALSDSGKVVFWSNDPDEIVKRSGKPDLRGFTMMVIEQDWNPNALRLVREYAPDVERQVKGLRTVLENDGSRV